MQGLETGWSFGSYIHLTGCLRSQVYNIHEECRKEDREVLESIKSK